MTPQEDQIQRHMRTTATRMKIDAKRMGFGHGDNGNLVISSMTRTRLMFTMDHGHHTSGWWKNPQYERCFHLSMSPLPSPIILPGSLTDLDRKTRDGWLNAFFASDVDKLWVEPPFSRAGKENGVFHYRLFLDDQMQPIVPKKEVYSKDFTPAGWKSFSDVRAQESAVENFRDCGVKF